MKFDSDTVSVLSALSLRKHNFSTNTHIITLKAKVLCEKANFLYKINKNFNLTNDCLDLKNEIEKHFKSELDLPYDEELIEKFEREIQDADLGTSDDLVEEVYQNRLKEIEEISYIQAFNNTPEISKLLHDIRKDKPSFRSLINHNDLEKVICVKPQLNNNRIIRQQGCFLLFGIDKIKEKKAILNNNWIKKDNNGSKFIIPKKSKENILSELKTFGISQKTLFPELESQAKEILEKYKK